MLYIPWKLNRWIECLKKKTPDLKELYTRGGYRSEDNDKKFEEFKITHIEAAVRGRENRVDIKNEKTTEGASDMSCLQQRVKSEKTRSRYTSLF